MASGQAFEETLARNCTLRPVDPRLPCLFFDAVLAANPDVVHLQNHDSNLVLGRTSAGTTVLSTDTRGLRFRTKVPDTTYARDLCASFARGDIRGSSFASSIDPDGQSWDDQDDPETGERCIVRTIHAVSSLSDVSTVCSPAYLGTFSGVDVRARPPGIPSEFRSRILRTATATDDPCQCECEACVGGDCAGCTNEACDDENCGGCPMQDTRWSRATGAQKSRERRLKLALAE